MEDVWRQVQADKHRLATAYNAIGPRRNPAESGMIPSRSVASSTGFQLGNSGGRATSSVDFSSGFPSGKYDELSALGDLVRDAWSRGPAQRHVFGQGAQFAANQTEPSQPTDWRKSAVDPRSPGYPPNFGANVGTILGELSLPKFPKLGQPPQVAPDVLGEKYRALARAVGMGEGNYESYNTGTIGRSGPVVHTLINNAAGTVPGKTINEMFATQKLPPTNRNRMFAVGPFGITFPTLRDAVHAMRLVQSSSGDVPACLL